MLIRDAIFNDLQYLLPLAQAAHRRSNIGHIDMNQLAIQRSFVTAIAFEQGFAKTVVHNNRVVGGMVGLLFENHFGVLCAQDLFTVSLRGTDQLIKSFKQWALDHNAALISISDMGGSERYQKMLLLLGLRPSSTNFMGVL